MKNDLVPGLEGGDVPIYGNTEISLYIAGKTFN